MKILPIKGHISPKGPPRVLTEGCMNMTKSGLACVCCVCCV